MGKAYLIRKADNSFLPAYDSDYEAMKRIKIGEAIEVNFSKPRNYENHKRFFAMLKMTIQNLPDNFNDRYRNQDYLRLECLVAVGHCNIIETLGGKVIFQPKSMNFASMDEEKFNKLYSLVSNYLLKHFLKGMSQEVFEKNLNLFL